MTNPLKRAIKAMLYPLYERRLLRQLDFTQTPHHVGVILDGNRRWAKTNFGATPEEGHRAGAEKSCFLCQFGVCIFSTCRLE